MQIACKFLSILAALFLFISAPHADEFKLEDLRAMVAELETVVPQNPSYRYPIEISILEKDEANAAAGYRWIEAEQVAQAVLEVNSGMIAAVNGDWRLLRAVLGHEMGHLALGHAIENGNFHDLDHHLTRQEEHAADAAAVTYLEALGYAKKDVVDMLVFLDSDIPKSYPVWLMVTASDHASPITRAALIDGDDTVLLALSRFEVGLAFMECRRYEEAIAWFEAALTIEPRMHEAHVNIALSAVQDYYEKLPRKVQEEWLRPEFISHLTSTVLLSGRAFEVTPKDHARYQRAHDRIGEIPAGRYVDTAGFLRGTLQVLHPQGDAEAIRAGIEELRGLLLSDATSVPFSRKVEHLRVANNIAVGLARLGETGQAQKSLVRESMRVAEVWLASASENVGRMPHDGLTEDEKLRALGATIDYLNRTPSDTPHYGPVERTMKALLQTLNRSLTGEIKAPPLYLCQAVMMTVDGASVRLFEPVNRYVIALGEPSDAGFILEKYPDLGCMIWGQGDLFLLTERGQVMKVTSYRPGSTIELRPKNKDLRETYVLKVGMTEAELDTLLEPTGNRALTKPAQILGRMILGGAPQPELWRYYPSLNLGVLLQDGKVKALSVTPAKISDDKIKDDD